MDPVFDTEDRDKYSKKPSDHCAIQTNLKISLNMIKNRKRPIINFKNKDGWGRYKVISDRYADKFKDLVKSNDNINTLRLNLDILNREIQIESFGIIWVGSKTSSKNSKKKRKESRELKELFKEQQEELDRMLQV